MKSSKIFSGSVFAFSLALVTPSVFADDLTEADLGERAYPVQAEGETEASYNEQSAAESLRLWQTKLAEYQRMGGPALKSGLVARAEREVARYQRLVNEEAGVVKPSPVTPPEAVSHEARAERLRRMGGITTKVGLVQQAEAEARKAGSQKGQVETNVSANDRYPSSGKTIETVRARSSS